LTDVAGPSGEPLSHLCEHFRKCGQGAAAAVTSGTLRLNVYDLAGFLGPRPGVSSGSGTAGATGGGLSAGGAGGALLEPFAMSAR